MIEEHARVARVADDGVYVETLRQSACSSCKASAGCGNALLDNLFSGKRQMLRVLPYAGLKQGDEVVIGLQEDALLKGSFMVYSLPLVFMLVSAVLVALLLPSAADGWVILAGLAGLLAGFVWLRYYSDSIRFDERYQPVILRKASSRP
jgi:sigma-E factor negative regulatory protein RseC